MEDQKFYIIFQNEQSEKRNPYFIFNEEKSLGLSKVSYIKYNYEKYKDYEYLDKSPEQNTEIMFENLSRYFQISNQSSIKFYNKIDNLRLDISKFFEGNISSLISMVWSLIINLTDNYQPFIVYLEKHCLFLEKDIFLKLYYLYHKY